MSETDDTFEGELVADAARVLFINWWWCPIGLISVVDDEYSWIMMLTLCVSVCASSWTWRYVHQLFLSVCLSVCLFVCPSVCLFRCVSLVVVCLPLLRVSMSQCPSVRLSVCVSGWVVVKSWRVVNTASVRCVVYRSNAVLFTITLATIVDTLLREVVPPSALTTPAAVLIQYVGVSKNKRCVLTLTTLIMLICQ